MAHRRTLTQLPRDLARLTGATVTYRRGYNAAVDGRIPAELGSNGRWTYSSDDLPEIARTLGLPVLSSEKAAA